jgi:nitrogen fixation protein NifX
MKVAFCSSDGIYVNEHFGQTEKIYVYEISNDEASFIECRNVKKANPNIDHLDKIDEKIDQISDCRIVYFTQIGGPAAAKVIKNKIFPVKVGPDSLVETIIKEMQRSFKKPPLWLKKLLYESDKSNELESEK